MFTGKCTLLKAEAGEISTTKKPFYRGALLTSEGEVVKVGMGAEVYETVKGLTAQSIQGVATIVLKMRTFGGKETLKCYLMSFNSK